MVFAVKALNERTAIVAELRSVHSRALCGRHNRPARSSSRADFPKSSGSAVNHNLPQTQARFCKPRL